MTVMALAIARAREDECDTLEGHAMYDSSGEVVGWLGQVMEESGYPCEHMGMGDEGYTSCWSSSEISRLRAENAKLRELATRFADYVGQDRCEGCVTKTSCDNGLMDECLLLTEIREIADGLGIEVDE